MSSGFLLPLFRSSVQGRLPRSSTHVDALLPLLLLRRRRTARLTHARLVEDQILFDCDWLEEAIMAHTTTAKRTSVYLYIPNILGYLRVLLNVVAFALCFSSKLLFAILYFISFACDGVDGWLARKFNQVSTFGAVLDMVTDRVSTACLLAILSQLYRPGLIFLALLGLDIASHWLQMYSTFVCGKSSHKDVKDKNSWLLRAYYQHRYFMAFCCVGSEVLYIILFLIHQKQDESLISACVNATKNSLPLSVLFTLALFGWGIKQIVNVIQMKTAADACVIYDTRGKEKQ